MQVTALPLETEIHAKPVKDLPTEVLSLVFELLWEDPDNTHQLTRCLLISNKWSSAAAQVYYKNLWLTGRKISSQYYTLSTT